MIFNGEFEISEKLRGKFEASLSHIHINKEKEVKFHCETEAAFVNLRLHNYRLEGTMARIVIISKSPTISVRADLLYLS